MGKIKLKTPLVSSPMDTVTESNTAIAMALEGAVGIIHCNMSIEEQAKLVGLVTKRDTDFAKDRAGTRVGTVMTPVDKLTVAEDGITLQDANKIIQSSKKGSLPILSKAGLLVAFMHRNDLKKNADFPLATKDENKQLVVAASVGTRPNDKDRVRALVAVGVDALVIDSSQGDSMYQHEMVKWMKQEFSKLEVIAGNVVTKRQAKHLIDCGADALRVGMGIGSICTTQEEPMP